MINRQVADKYSMTGHKLLWHLDRVNSWVKGERIAPLHIELGITNGCNLACVYCYGDMIGKTDKGNKFDMPRETILKLFKDAKDVGVKSIGLVGEGENTISPYFYDAIDYARSIGLDIGMATNGIAFKESKVRDMLESFVWIRFSLSGSNRESYLRIHGMDRFDRVIKNIKKCVETKRKYGLRTTLGTQMVVTHDNREEIVPLAKLGKELGVDYFVAKPCSDTPDRRLNVVHEEYLQMGDIFREAESYSDENYSVVIKWNKFNNLGLNEFKTCYGTQFNMTINAKGDVAPCGHLLGYRKDEFHMGNIVEQSFKDIISSERYWEAQKRVQTLDVNKECETNCLHHYINSFLEVLKNPPEHINFV